MGVTCSYNEVDTTKDVAINTHIKQRIPSLLDEPFQILSPVFTQKDVADWTNTALLIHHEPIRYGLDIMIDISNPKHYGGGNVKSWSQQIKIFYQWYDDIFYLYVTHHLSGDKEIYYPWLTNLGAKLPRKLTTNHETLLESLDAIKNGKNVFFDKKGTLKEIEFPDNLRALHKACTKLRNEMNQHLNVEEEIVPKLLRKHKVSQQEEAETVNRMWENLELGENKVMLPWIVDAMGRWGGKEMVTEFLELVPGPILFLYKMWWRDHYRVCNKEILKKITSV